jgi:hypothetical protein
MKPRLSGVGVEEVRGVTTQGSSFSSTEIESACCPRPSLRVQVIKISENSEGIVREKEES